MEMTTRLGRIEMKNPVTVASGTFGLNYGDLIDLNRLGALVTKTITMEPRAGNPPPRLYETECGLLNSIGLQNPGLEGFLQHDLPRYREFEPPILVSFSGNSIDQFQRMMEQMEEHDGIAGYEVNVSCPNVEKEGIAFGTDPEVVFELTTALSRITNRELCVKLSPNVTDIVGIAQAAESGGATSIALINTLIGMAIDWRTGQSRIARGGAGYSGRAVKPVAVYQVYRVAQKVKVPILAMGGISDWRDALEFFFAGASAVAIGTRNFVEPSATLEIIDGLHCYLKDKFSGLSDIIGKVRGITPL